MCYLVISMVRSEATERVFNISQSMIPNVSKNELKSETLKQEMTVLKR